MTLSFSALIRALFLSIPLLALSVDGTFAMQATVRWADKATSESGYKIERLVSSTGLYSQIALTRANITSFVDTNLLANTTYCYRVRAYNAAGNSAYSNEVCVYTSVRKVRLSVSLMGSGTLSGNPRGINCPSDCTEDYVAGTRVILTPSAGNGAKFANWGGACTGQGSRCVLTMTSTKNVTVTFKPRFINSR